ncbi:hypothetical protein [Actinacidiphila glaucinigra]|uniref:hypothetical protein n=1 Tax=Actinacidiphila glaucinigra TaxID=235986 RepID=UPI0035D9DB38
MSVDDEDTRKVQTAVAGRAGSDDPVFMPFDAEDFDRFLEHYPERSFYCGILLGGCGKRLSAKRYVDKKCHFAHHPPVHCKRTANSESSADHLYIGKALQLWFAQQGQRGVNPSYRPSGHLVGEAVDLVHSAGRHVLRVQMSRRSKAEWEAADTELAGLREHVEWLFGPDSMVANWQMERLGYALRVQCRTVGTTRSVEIGTQFPNKPVEWTTLSECRLSERGITTPSLTEMHRGVRGEFQRADRPPYSAAPVAFPLAAKTVAFTGAVRAVESPVSAAAARIIYHADVQPIGSAVVRAQLSLPADAPVPEYLRVYLLQGAVLSSLALPDKPDVKWLISADGIRLIEKAAAAMWQGLSSHPAASKSKPPKDRAIATTTPARHAADVLGVLAAVIDQTSLALDQEDMDSVRQGARELERLLGTELPRTDALRARQELQECEAWIAERRDADEQRASESLTSCLDWLDTEGDCLAVQELRRRIREAEDLSEEAGDHFWLEQEERLEQWQARLAVELNRPSRQEIRALGSIVRRALELVVQSKQVLSWEQLAEWAEPKLAALLPEDKLAVLVEADRETPESRPLLSAIVVESNRQRPDPAYWDVLFELEREVPHETVKRRNWRSVLQAHGIV